MECLSMKGREIFKLMKSPLKSGFYCKIHTCVKREHIFLSDSIFSIVIFFSICLSALYFLNILSELWEIITFVVCTVYTAHCAHHVHTGHDIVPCRFCPFGYTSCLSWIGLIASLHIPKVAQGSDKMGRMSENFLNLCFSCLVLGGAGWNHIGKMWREKAKTKKYHTSREVMK